MRVLLSGDSSQWDRALQMPHYNQARDACMRAARAEGGGVRAAEWAWWACRVWLRRIPGHVTRRVPPSLPPHPPRQSQYSMPAISLHTGHHLIQVRSVRMWVMRGGGRLRASLFNTASVRPATRFILPPPLTPPACPQLILSRQFTLYDYGSPAANRQHYGSPAPTDIAAHYGLLQVSSLALSLARAHVDGWVGGSPVHACASYTHPPTRTHPPQGLPIDLVAGRFDGIIAREDVLTHYKRMGASGVTVSYKEFACG